MRYTDYDGNEISRDDWESLRDDYEDGESDEPPPDPEPENEWDELLLLSDKDLQDARLLERAIEEREAWDMSEDFDSMEYDSDEEGDPYFGD